MEKEIDYSYLNKMVVEANDLIKNKNYGDAKKVLLEYINKASKLYEKFKSANNYSFRNIAEFYFFVHIFKTKNVRWINLKVDEAYRLLGYIEVEEKEYEKALDYLTESLKYNPINLETHYELVETYKMMGKLDKMEETLDIIYDYIYDETSLSRYYRNLGFYYIEKENYDLAFSLYLISLEYEYSQFALSEMLYIRQKLGKPDFIIKKEDAIQMIIDNDIKIGISSRNLSLLKALASDKKIKQYNPFYIKKIEDSIMVLSKLEK